MENPIDYKNLLEKTAEFAKMGSWQVDLNENKIYWSDVTKKIHEVEADYECDLEDALSFYEDPISQKIVNEAFEKAVTENIEYDVKLKIRTKKNNQKWVRAIGIPVFEHNQCVKVYGLFQDIDKQERAALEAFGRMKIINDIFLNSSVGMIISKLDGSISRTNKGIENILGYSKSELKELSFRDFTHPDELETSKGFIDRLINNQEKHISTEKKYVKKNGDVVHAILFLSLIRDKFGKPLHFLAQIIDVSKQVEAQNKMRALLNVTTDQNQRLLNFAHIVSHNLKSHSGNLKMLLELMDMEYPELKENELMPLFGQAVDNLAETIMHLNEVILVQTSEKKNFKLLNLNKYIKQTLNSIAGLVLEESAIIENNVDPEVNIQAVPAYLESILLNLLSNTLRYKSDKRRLKVIISNKIVNDNLILYVEDNGLGIDLKSHEEHLFGMYKTFHNHQDSRGIGLFITKNQIEAMGGKIEVESEVDKGTTFKIYFKYAKEN